MRKSRGKILPKRGWSNYPKCYRCTRRKERLLLMYCEYCTMLLKWFNKNKSVKPKNPYSYYRRGGGIEARRKASITK